MQISERTVGDVVVVDVSGKITLGDGGDVALRDKMRSLIQQDHKKVLLNLGDVPYVDSAVAMSDMANGDESLVAQGTA